MEPVAGVILVGGRSRRMGDGDKALIRLAGKSMLQHVIERVAPQVDALVLSVERHSARLDPFSLEQLPDPVAGHHGPLGGLLAAMRHFAVRPGWLLLTPCDAPFLPLDLAASLQGRARSVRARAATVACDGELQPTFSIWRLDLLPELERVAGPEQGGLKPILRAVGAVVCDWPANGASTEQDGPPPPFFNVNDPSDLARARRWFPGRSRGGHDAER